MEAALAHAAAAMSGSVAFHRTCRQATGADLRMPPIRTRTTLGSLLLAAVLAPASAAAQTITITATNPGPISGGGRDLVFDLAGVGGPVGAASLEIDLDYTSVRELDLRLVAVDGVVELPIAAFGSTTGTAGVRGRYRFTDRATATWWQAESQAAGGILATAYPTRAFQRGHDGDQCLNHIGRFLEYDIDRARPVVLRIARSPGGTPGQGAVSAARLVIESGRGDAVFASGLEEPADTVTPCRRASLDLLPNGAVEDQPASPLGVLHFGAGGLAWSVRQLQPAGDFGPVLFGTATNPPYVGRFGGRSRTNFGFWDAATGSLNFSTGAGARSLALPGDWTTTEHYPIPGDYDGDGITDLAVAFLGDFGGQPRWYARVRYSSTDGLRDFLVDPRAATGSGFSSSQIAFGPGQDSNLDGYDELTQFARFTSAMTTMRMVVWNIRPDLAQAEGFVSGGWGEAGDTMVLGRWIDVPGPGNRYSQMVVRRTPAGLDWYLFGNLTPTRWGLPDDQPLSINVDGDVRHDIAVFRPSNRRIYAIRSSDGVVVEFDAYAPAPGTPGFVYALGFLQGTLALPTF
jgi:hypothetical protein